MQNEQAKRCCCSRKSTHMSAATATYLQHTERNPREKHGESFDHIPSRPFEFRSHAHCNFSEHAGTPIDSSIEPRLCIQNSSERILIVHLFVPTHRVARATKAFIAAAPSESATAA